MNKLFIPIIVILIITAGIGAFFIFQKPAFPQPPAGKCGDGICDEKEKNNPNLCPQDCEKKQSASDAKPTTAIPTTTPALTQEPQEGVSKDSPFGIFGLYEWKLDSPKVASVSDINNYLKDIGIKWVQEMYFTKELNEIPEGVYIYSRVGREGGNKPPDTSEKYKEALREIIKKYKGKIKYWEVSTEPNGFSPPKGWRDYPKEYAIFLKETYKIIKSECSDCRVVFGGLYGVGTGVSENSESAKFLKAVLEAGAAHYFDVFEFKQHAANANDYQELKNKIEVFGKILADYGLDIKKIPVFVETATHDGNPSLPALEVKLSSQTEAQQAVGLLKYYVYGLKSGIDKIFWNLIIERHNFAGRSDNPFNFYGLVNNPDNDGLSHKKLSYYSYKKMVEVLEGSDWNNIQTIQEKNGIYIYKFTKQGKSIWVAWNDSKEQKEITISGITLKQIKITESVPKYESGKDVTDYNTAFNTETKTVSGGKITITLKDKPVFVEEK